MKTRVDLLLESISTLVEANTHEIKSRELKELLTNEAKNPVQWIEAADYAGVDVSNLGKLVKWLDKKVDDRGIIDYIKDNHKELLKKAGV